MTKKIAISVPDDVAERLAREPNVSAYIADTVRRRMAGERARERLNSIGFAITDEDMDRAGERIDHALDGITPDLAAHAADLYAKIARARAWLASGASADEAVERINRHRARLESGPGEAARQHAA